MIQDIEIKNFRCFDETKISGFTRVNLIGGKNNSGKTALLEALYLYSLPIPESLLFLRQLRKESDTFSKTFPDQTWDYLFFNKRKDNKIELSGNPDVNCLTTIKIYSQKQIIYVPVSPLENQTQKINNTVINIDFKFQIGDLNDPYYSEMSFQAYLSGKLEINNNRPINVHAHTTTRNGIVETPVSLKNAEEIKEKIKNQIENPEKYAIFISSDQRAKNIDLALKYDQAVLNNKTSEVLTLLKLIDNNIEEVRTISLGEPTLYLKRYNESFLPLSMFGDALNRIVDIALNLINIPDGILLIDEIENGIHYLNQKEFWHNLFKISQALNVQIFATTHSLEMIKAFADIGLEYYPEESAYFELSRHPKTNQIIGIKWEMETVDYALKYEQGVGLRGE